MAISEERYAKVVGMLQSGKFTHAEIAEEVGVGKKTVQRINDKIKEAPPSEDEGFTKKSYEDYITKAEKKYIARYKNIIEYEDEEEGWTFHIEDLKEYRRQSGCWFVAIAYPESAPEDWKERLEAMGLEIAISPLHDKDVWNHDSPEVIDKETGEILLKKGERYKCGDKKKPHWHILIKTQQRCSVDEMNFRIRAITNGPYVQKCNSLRGMYNYLTHETNAEKYHYEKSEIVLLNGFLVELTKAEQKLILTEVLVYVTEHEELDCLSKVVKTYKNNYEYMTVISAKAYAITQICNDNWRKRNPDGKVKRVIVMKDEKEN